MGLPHATKGAGLCVPAVSMMPAQAAPHSVGWRRSPVSTSLRRTRSMREPLGLVLSGPTPIDDLARMDYPAGSAA